jgi:hypothetical protein
MAKAMGIATLNPSYGQLLSASAFAAQMKSFSLKPPTSWVEKRTTQRS